MTNNYNLRMLPIAEAECMTLIRQMYSQRQLYEVMIDFWHDHFSVNGFDYDGGPMFPAFDAIFRDTSSGNGVFGNFETLLMRIAKSASMMYMLDLYSSTAQGPNENYARELCELHTLGAMNYAGVVASGSNHRHLQLAHGHRCRRLSDTPAVCRRRRVSSHQRA